MQCYIIDNNKKKIKYRQRTMFVLLANSTNIDCVNRSP